MSPLPGMTTFYTANPKTELGHYRVAGRIAGLGLQCATYLGT